MRKGKARWSMVVTLLLVVNLVLAACSSGGPGGNEAAGGDKNEQEGKKELAEEQVLHLKVGSEITSLDSSIAFDGRSFSVLERIQSGLMIIANQKAVPDMAAMPEVSEDGKVYTYTIRDNAVWSDGSPVTAHDFVYAWHRFLKPETKSYGYIYKIAKIKNAAKIIDPDSEMYGKVEQLGVKAIDDKTLQVTLEKATPYFNSLMSIPTFFPLKQEFVEEQGSDYAKEPENLLFNGAYSLKEWNHGVGWTLVKNDKYWDSEKVNIEKATFNLIKQTNTALNLYKTNELDIVDLTSEKVNNYKDSPEYHAVPGNCMSYIGLNLIHVPEFKNKKLRQAISMAINREGMTEVLLNNGSLPAHYIVPKNFAKDPDGKDFRAKVPEGYLVGTLEEAKKLWKKAKQELGIETLELEYLTTDGESEAKYAEFIANQIGQLEGITMTINKQPYNSYLEIVNNDNFDISALGWCPDYQDPMAFLELFEKENPGNPIGYANKEFNQLIKEAKQLGNQPEERWALLHQAEELLINDAAVVPLYQSGQAILVKPYVEGIVFQGFGLGKFFRYAKVYKH